MFSVFATSKKSLLALPLLAVSLLGVGSGRAQLTGQKPAPLINDPFAAFHASLTNTADKVLAAPIQHPVEAQRGEPTLATATAKPEPTHASRPAGAINRVRQLRPIIEPILREERVPTELAAIVLVESGGQRNALSPKGARGVWQFMPDTARRYGLIVTPERDERLDIERSTRAAARYLRDLHGQFGDWQLAFAAYNAGGDLVQHAINRNGTRDFSKLSRSVPLETRKYVPAVVAATKMFSNPNSPLVAIRSVRPLWQVYAGVRSGN